MTAQGENILAFLDRAITAREEAAYAAPRSPWTVRMDDDAIVAPDGITVAEAFALSGQQTRAILAHIALNDPASVLRRCAADRKLIALHAVVPDHGRFSEAECPANCDGDHSGPGVCFSCRTYAGDPVEAPCPSLRVLAEGYGWTEGER